MPRTIVPGHVAHHSYLSPVCNLYRPHSHGVGNPDYIEFPDEEPERDRLTEVLEVLVNNLTPSSTVEARHARTLAILERIATAVERSNLPTVGQVLDDLRSSEDGPGEPLYSKRKALTDSLIASGASPDSALLRHGWPAAILRELWQRGWQVVKR